MNNRAILAFFSCTIFANLAACAPPDSPAVEYRASNASGGAPIEEIAYAPIESKDVILAFNREKAHDILYVLNLVKQSPINFEALEIVACAVEHCDIADENWNWEALRTELVRVNLMDVLLQADRNGFPILDSEELLKEILSGLGSRNPQVVQQSLLVLGSQNEKKYAPEIERVARATKNDTTFRVAIIALRFMSTELGEPIVARIRVDSSAHRQSIIDEVVPVTTVGGSD